MKPKSSQAADGSWHVRVDARGRITLPKALLAELGWKPGDVLLWETDQGRLTLRKKPETPT